MRSGHPEIIPVSIGNDCSHGSKGSAVTSAFVSLLISSPSWVDESVSCRLSSPH